MINSRICGKSIIYLKNIKEDNANGDITAIYTINGMHTNSIQKRGLYIIRYNSGKTAKAVE